jgi:hypothetical protein
MDDDTSKDAVTKVKNLINFIPLRQIGKKNIEKLQQ